MPKKINISCKKASFLISKKQETPLSTLEKLRLWLHLLSCTACKLFKKQTETIIQLLKKTQPITPPPSLSGTAKQQLQQVLDNEMRNTPPAA